MIPDFMNVQFTYPEKNKMAWEFNQNKCFAYSGIKRLGVIEQYECGVLYRIKCWLDELGITHRFIPEIGKCHMHFNGIVREKYSYFFNNHYQCRTMKILSDSLSFTVNLWHWPLKQTETETLRAILIDSILHPVFIHFQRLISNGLT